MTSTTAITGGHCGHLLDTSFGTFYLGGDPGRRTLGAPNASPPVSPNRRTPMLKKLPFPSVAGLSSRSKKHVGLPPGAVVFTGRDRTGPIHIDVMNYAEEHLTEESDVSLETAFAHRDRPGPSWINVSGVHDASVVQKFGEYFGLHPLVQEDIAHIGQRPKLEAYDDYVFIVLKMLTLPNGLPTKTANTQRPEDGTDAGVEARLQAEQISLVVGDEWLISFQEEAGDMFGPIRDRLRGGRGRIRKRGADYLAYALVDVIIDHYFVVLEHLGNRIEALEDEVLEEATPETQEKINLVRRNLVSMRRMTWPVREILSQMDRVDSRIWDEETRPFVRDAYDHTVQVLDLVESLRDVVGGLTDLYMTSLSNRMNEIMKVLTIIGTIFIPLTFVAGIYGMNFEYMPELGVWWMYPAVWGVMITTAIVLLIFFRRKDWI